MTHHARILKALRDLPRAKGKPRSLPRTVLIGLARTPTEKRAANELIDYMVALGELRPLGGRKLRTFAVGKV